MQLIKVYANQPSFRTIEFNKTGLNFIVAKQKNPGESEKGKTYNGVGKSLLVRIIHFCLGAKAKNYEAFCEKLQGWEFCVDYEIDGQKYTAKRSTNHPNIIMLNDEDVTVNTYNKRMALLCFEIPGDIDYLSFRSLIPFFIRPKKESYVAYDRPGKTGKEYQSLLYNSFLLGLDVALVQKKREIRKKQEGISELEKNFEKDTLLKDFFTGNKDVVLSLIDIEEQIKKLENDLSNFKVAEDYNKIQSEADEVKANLLKTRNKVVLLQSNIENIDKNLSVQSDISKENIKMIYNESNICFSKETTKTLEELDVFYKKLISNRKARLLEQQNKLKIEHKDKEIEVKKLQAELDKRIQYLGEHHALDLFVSISNKSAGLKAERDSLQKYQSLQAEYKTQERQADKDLFELIELAENYLEEIKTDTTELRDYFRGLAKIFYPQSIAGLTIESNDGANQLSFNINAKIESDSSDGINNVKIFCYDLTMLFKGYKHKINFIFHDSRLFSDIDERQKADLFKILFNKFVGSNKQYIATVNQNQLNEIKAKLTDVEYEEIVAKNTVLTLTDESPSAKLLGIKVDLPEE